jgi:putative oxidoreductase
MKVGLMVLRMVVGGLFFGHGAQKVLGWFGGHGLDATTQAFESMGMRPARRNALMAGASEAGGGAMLAAGALTPLAGAALIGVMATAAWMVHRPKGVWVTEGGYEYTLVLGAAAFAIVADGPGAMSVDDREWGLPWAIAALAAGLGGAAFVVMEAQKEMEAQGQAPSGDGGAPQEQEQEQPATPTA